MNFRDNLTNEIYEEPKKRRLVPYYIETDSTSFPLPIAAGGTITTSPGITIGPKPFVWTNLHIKIWGDSTDFSIRIRDEGSAMDFTKDKIHADGMVRLDSSEKELAVEWTFPKFSTIVVEATNNDATHTGNIRITFHGYLIFENETV